LARGKRVSRRRFLELIAAGSAAVVTGAGAPASGQAAARPKRKVRPAAATGEPRPRTAVVQAEIEKQKGYLAAALKKIREHPLPPGSEPAFGFAPLKARPHADREERERR
jgi:hypothetical protein